MRRLEGAVTSARRLLKDVRVWWLLCAGMATCMAGAAAAQPSAAIPAEIAPPVEACTKIAAAALPDAVGLTADLVPVGAADDLASSAAANGLPIIGPPTGAPNQAFCRLRATLKPSRASRIRMEIWMPARGWNGKFIGLGNFGWAGGIPYVNLLAGLGRGSAVAANDTGHDSKGSDGEGGRFLLGNPEALIDYAWRANHAMTVAAKTLIQRYYAKGPRQSYWIGCSLGGLQGLIEAKRFPEDYDGIVAGAPPNPVFLFNAAQLWPNWLSTQDSSMRLSEAKLALLHQSVLKTCAGPAGKAFGYVEDPGACVFDPGQIACAKGEGPDCLTPAEVKFARLVYQGPVDPMTGKVLFPGPAKGSELGWTPYVNGREFTTAADLYRFAVLQDPKWTSAKLSWARDVPKAAAKLGPLMQVDDDLSAFAKRGGRLLLFVGGAEYHNPAELGDYLMRVRAKIAQTLDHADHYARLIVIPGMAHCGGGAGCDTLDKVEVIDAWVDRQGRNKPTQTSRIEDGRVTRTQPLCYFPATPVYKGEGDLKDASNFTCKTL